MNQNRSQYHTASVKKNISSAKVNHVKNATVDWLIGWLIDLLVDLLIDWWLQHIYWTKLYIPMQTECNTEMKKNPADKIVKIRT